MSSTAFATLVAPAGETRTVTATTYYRTFSHSHPPLLRVRSGDAIATKMVVTVAGSMALRIPRSVLPAPSPEAAK